jgi:ATP-dependent 26S proteasome regulatory subunit
MRTPLESALAARPGRVDRAVALELPDAGARRQLFDLYRGDLAVDESRLDALIERTDGVTASFLKELLRRAALIAADDGGTQLTVSADQLDAALDELMDTRNAMTRVLLGAERLHDLDDRKGKRRQRSRPVAAPEPEPAVAPAVQL